ncbi:MAG: esterase family protein [Defluviitaleaceae bacterium]|nr:esterase family protein [Defluviitaleaceae bacterium]
MAHISATVFPKSLGFRTRIEVIIPQHPDSGLTGDKVLYLLHGLSDDSTAWMRNTRIEHYAEKRGYIVIMPEVQRSFYCDMKYGSQYFTYVSEELPKLCEQLFNVTHSREKTFVAGLSMGGYGAIKCALSKPHFYSACAGFSGALDMEFRLEDAYNNGYKEVYAIMDKDERVPDHSNLFKLADKMANLPKSEQARVLVTCGEVDFLIDDNRKFNNHMKSLPIDYTYKEWEGNHDWNFWEECLPLAFDFFEKKA